MTRLPLSSNKRNEQERVRTFVSRQLWAFSPFPELTLSWGQTRIIIRRRRNGCNTTNYSIYDNDDINESDVNNNSVCVSVVETHFWNDKRPLFNRPSTSRVSFINACPVVVVYVNKQMTPCVVQSRRGQDQMPRTGVTNAFYNEKSFYSEFCWSYLMCTMLLRSKIYPC